MNTFLKIKSPLVSVNWLFAHKDAPNLIILDATIEKVTRTFSKTKPEKEQLLGAIFFDLKNIFSDQNAPYPNTMLSLEKFEKEVSKIGVQKDSVIVVYDDIGMYSSARVWWLFKSMGFTNIAVLDGGFPAWKNATYPLGNSKKTKHNKGNFKATYTNGMICNTEAVLIAIYDVNTHIIDARSEGRFFGLVPEPREGLRGGHIPNSKNLPYAELFEDGLLKSKEKLEFLFHTLNPKKDNMIFTCGSGITACILALGAEIAGYVNTTVYDGSWTEWGSRLELPIEK